MIIIKRFMLAVFLIVESAKVIDFFVIKAIQVKKKLYLCAVNEKTDSHIRFHGQYRHTDA